MPAFSRIGGRARVGGAGTRVTPRTVPAPRQLRGQGWSYDTLAAVRELRRANPAGKPIANLGPVTGKTFGSAPYGLAMEARMQAWLMRQYPGVPFKFNRVGVDVAVPPTASNVPFSYAEFKPRTPAGRKKFRTQMNNWGHPYSRTRAYTYDAQGNIYDGWS